MKHLKMFESWSNRPGGPYSQWPQTKHYRAFKVIRVLDPATSQDDKKEIEEVMKDLYLNFQYYREYAKDGEFKIPENWRVPDDLFAAEIMRPDGKVETVVFDDLEIEDKSEGYGFIPGNTVDGKYEFLLPVNLYTAPYSDEYEITEVLWDEIEWL